MLTGGACHLEPPTWVPLLFHLLEYCHVGLLGDCKQKGPWLCPNVI